MAMIMIVLVSGKDDLKKFMQTRNRVDDLKHRLVKFYRATLLMKLMCAESKKPRPKLVYHISVLVNGIMLLLMIISIGLIIMNNEMEKLGLIYLVQKKTIVGVVRYVANVDTQNLHQLIIVAVEVEVVIIVVRMVEYANSARVLAFIAVQKTLKNHLYLAAVVMLLVLVLVRDIAEETVKVYVNQLVKALVKKRLLIVI